MTTTCRAARFCTAGITGHCDTGALGTIRAEASPARRTSAVRSALIDEGHIGRKCRIPRGGGNALPESQWGRSPSASSEARAASNAAERAHCAPGSGWLGPTAPGGGNGRPCRCDEGPERLVDRLGGGADLREVRIEENDAGAGPCTLEVLAPDAVLELPEVDLAPRNRSTGLRIRGPERGGHEGKAVHGGADHRGAQGG